MIELDGTDGKRRLGANAVLGVSLAVARAAAAAAGLPLYAYIGGAGARVLPVPMMNVLNGGAHADNNVDIQEFMIVPHGADSFAAAMRMGVETYHALKEVLRKAGHRTGVGDEGGFAPDLRADDEAMDLLVAAMDAAGYEPGRDVSIAVDAAASGFYDRRRRTYRLAAEERDVDGMIAFYRDLTERYPLVSIEDPLAEDDWPGWRRLTAALGGSVQVVGDDIFVTNTALIARGAGEGTANSVLIKPNQIGTLSETIAAVDTAVRAGMTTVVSHRSGETEDTTIADLSVALNTGWIKTGAPCRTERVAKYNQLLRIEEDLGGAAVFAGGLWRAKRLDKAQ
jgi:enolase